MQTFTNAAIPRTCPCGAACASANTLCPKCIARLRWLRRQAWRTNPVQRKKTHQALAGKR